MSTRNPTSITEIRPAHPVAPGIPAHSALGNGSALIAADVVALGCAALVAFGLGVLTSPIITGSVYVAFGAALSVRWGIFMAASGIAISWLHFHGHYSERVPLWTELRDLLRVAGTMLMLEGFLQFAFKADISRLWILVTWALFPSFAILFRSCLKRLLTRTGSWLIPTIVFGKPQESTFVAEAMAAEPMLGFDIVAASAPLPPEEAIAAMRRTGASFAVIAQSETGDDHSVAIARAMSQAGVRFALAPPFTGLTLSGMRNQFIFGHDVLLLMERGGLLRRPAQTLKRCFDIAAATAAIILLAPVMAVVALMVKSDGGPILFRHERIGRAGAPFACIKFRTMVVDAEERLSDLLAGDQDAADQWKRYRKLKNDPRLTRWGRFLRRTSLDELPQILNVLRGDMSLVGPRPLTKPELLAYGDDMPLVLRVRPGITGLWQISGRNDTDFSRRIALDSWYVRNWSFGYDILIVALTLPVLLSRRGAY